MVDPLTTSNGFRWVRPGSLVTALGVRACVSEEIDSIRGFSVEKRNLSKIVKKGEIIAFGLVVILWMSSKLLESD